MNNLQVPSSLEMLILDLYFQVKRPCYGALLGAVSSSGLKNDLGDWDGGPLQGKRMGGSAHIPTLVRRESPPWLRLWPFWHGPD